MLEKKITQVNTTIRITDQIGQDVTLLSPAKRIISLVPSLTELLFDLNLQNEIVGRTKFCIYPQDLVQQVEIIGGTKNVNIEKIHSLQPDLIIANKEENLRETVMELRKSFAVYTSNISTLHAALHAIEDIGHLSQRNTESENLITSIDCAFSELDNSKRKTCIYLIWKDPYMTVGKDTFIFDMLNYAGFESIIEDYRYPEVTIDDILKLDPEYILLSSEPFPFRAKHILQLREILPNKKIILVDGTYFSWYGSRIKDAPNYFKELGKNL